MEETTATTPVTPGVMPGNSEIRHKAYTTLTGHWLYPVLATLLFTAVTAIVSNIPLANLLVMAPLEFGFALAFLKLVRGDIAHEDVVTAPFHPFKEYGRYLGGSLLVFLFTFLWMLLLIVPGIIKGLSYTLTPYIMYDNPDMPVREAVRRSQQMMNGYKWKLFCLYLSFIGWFLLGCITLGIGMLWVTPYVQAAEAHFYEELKARC